MTRRAVFRELPSWSRAITLARTRSCPAAVSLVSPVFEIFTRTRVERPAVAESLPLPSPASVSRPWQKPTARAEQPTSIPTALPVALALGEIATAGPSVPAGSS